MTSHEYQKIITQLRVNNLHSELTYQKEIQPYLAMFEKTHGDRVASGEIPPLQTEFTDIQWTALKLYETNWRGLKDVFDVYEEQDEAVIPNSLLGGAPLIEWYTYVYYIPMRPSKKRVHRWLTEDGYSARGYTISTMFLAHVFGFDEIKYQRNKQASRFGEKLPYSYYGYLTVDRLPMGNIHEQYEKDGMVSFAEAHGLIVKEEDDRLTKDDN
jgi:hypothetical protein